MLENTDNSNLDGELEELSKKKERYEIAFTTVTKKIIYNGSSDFLLRVKNSYQKKINELQVRIQTIKNKNND